MLTTCKSLYLRSEVLLAAPTNWVLTERWEYRFLVQLAANPTSMWNFRLKTDSVINLDFNDRRWHHLLEDSVLTWVGSQNRFPRLASVNLDGCHTVHDAGGVAMARGCTQLTALDLADTGVSSEALEAVAGGCPKLCDLNIWGCGVTGGLIAVVRRCSQLFKLEANNCDGLREAELIRAFSELQNLSPEFRNLSWLGLSNNHKSVTDAVLVAISRGCPKLAHLDLFDARKITDAGVIAVAQGCSELNTLILNGCDHITAAAVLAIAQLCPRLIQLDLVCGDGSHLDDDVVEAIARGCPEIRVLSLVGDGVGDDSAKSIATRCPEITNLELRGCSVGIEGLAALGEDCKQLATLSMEGSCVFDEDLHAIAESFGTQLTRLDISGGHSSITDDGVLALAEACTQIAWLNLSGCVEITDEALEALGENCPGLVELQLAGCTRIRNVLLAAGRGVDAKHY